MANISKEANTNITKAVEIIEQGGGSVTIGGGTYFNSGSVRAQRDNIIIGKFCRISYDVVFLTNYGSHYLLSDDKKVRAGLIIIGDNVWIGWSARIRGGVIVGDFAVIGMSAVVVKDVEPFHVVVGNPAKDIGLRPDTEKIIRLIKKRCGNVVGTPFEILTKFKQQGYTFAEAGQSPKEGASFFVAEKGQKLLYTKEFRVEE